MVTTVAHLYPWDVVGDPDAVARVASLGVDAVALAASYHTVRAATPFHPSHRMVDARHAAFYLPVREEVWRGKRLAPAEPSWMDSGDSYGEAAAALRAAGLPVYAWTVLTHSSRLGDANPDVVVRNAFGDLYPYALCPSNDDVVEYARTLVSEVLELGRPDGVVLEACGPLGFFHGGHHEKTDGTDWSAVQQKLLSLCFCSACLTRYTDPDGLRAAVRAGIDSGATGVEEALGDQAAHVREVRTEISRSLRRELVGLIRSTAPEVRIAAHATADPWGTGPFATVAGGVDADVDVLTMTCWPGVDASVPAIRSLRAEADVRTAAYVLALPPKPADGDELLKEWLAYAEAGVQEFHLYHAGLASARRMDALRHAVTGIKAALAPSP